MARVSQDFGRRTCKTRTEGKARRVYRSSSEGVGGRIDLKRDGRPASTAARRAGDLDGPAYFDRTTGSKDGGLTGLVGSRHRFELLRRQNAYRNPGYPGDRWSIGGEPSTSEAVPFPGDCPIASRACIIDWIRGLIAISQSRFSYSPNFSIAFSKRYFALLERARLRKLYAAAI